MNHADTIILAKQIVPIDAPPIRDAAMVIRKGRIVGLGPVTQICQGFAAAAVIQLGDVSIFPGLINAHTHLELSNCTCDDDLGGSFINWITTIRRRRLAAGDTLDEAAAKSVAIGIEQCLRFGVTTVGDIAHSFEIVRPLLAKSPLRAVSYGEALGLGKSKSLQFDPKLELALDTRDQTDRLRIGITPHAPYTVDTESYQRSVNIARERNVPFATHLAEDEHEEHFLRQQRGPFRDVWDSLGHWEDGIKTFDGTPVELAEHVGLLDLSATILAHVNYCSDSDLALLSRGRASVAYCPRTHRYFRRPKHRWIEMLAKGVNVVVGTDSTASSPDLNLLDELRLLRQLAPEFDVRELWSMVTTRAARALGFKESVGDLVIGQRADFIVFDDSHDDALTRVLDAPKLNPVQVWINGQLAMTRQAC